MDPGRLFRREGLSVAWRRQVKGVLWRIVPDHDGGLIGEERDPATRSVSFFRVHVAGGEVVWKDIAAPGGWWTGIECVTHGALLLHGFASPDLPVHRGLTAVDLHTGAVLWSDDAVVFVAVADGVVYGLRARSEGRELVGRNLLTGGVIIEEPADEARLQRVAAQWQADIPPSFALPEPPQAGSVEHTLARTLLAGGSLAENAVETLRVGEMTVTAHHERVPEGPPGRPLFRRVLSVFGGEAATPAYREILDDSLTMPVPEAFFVVGRTLLFVKGRRTLCALHLSDGTGRG
jgi:hypothetical protein